MAGMDGLSPEAVAFLRNIDAPVVHQISKADALSKLHVDFKARLMEQVGRFQIGIVVALPKEWAAAVRVADKQEPFFHPLEDVTYHVLTIGTSPRAHHVVLALCPKMGNSASAIAATAMLKDFPRIADIIMLGIAGGIPNVDDPETDVRLGDIVVSSGKGLVQYDMTKIEDDRIVVRSIAPTPSARLTQIVQQLEGLRLVDGSRPWDSHIDEASKIESGSRPVEDTDPLNAERKLKAQVDPTRVSKRPKVHYGTIGSANALVKKTELRDELRKTHGVLAVEMEGSGIADAAWFQGKGYLIVRGICDYCDKTKSNTWQGYASAAAAGYMRAIVERIAPA